MLLHLSPCHKRLCCYLALLNIVLLSLTSCQGHRYRIGVSQCYHNDWNTQVNRDLEREADSHPEIELISRLTNQGTQGQIADLQELIDQGVDLLIFAPEEATALSPIVDQAHAKGIPVILIDSETDSPNYTALVQTDNVGVGLRGGEYLAQQLQGEGKIIDILGIHHATASLHRHQGFSEALAPYPDIQIIDSCYTSWAYESAYPLIDSLLALHPDVDAIAAQNDALALAAYDACQHHHLDPMPLIIGVDALAGAGNGIQNVAEGKISASCTNPTGGMEAIHLALDILEGRPYERLTLMPTQLIDRNNVQVILSQEERIDMLNARIEEVNGRLGNYLHRTTTLQLLIAAVVLLLLLSIAFTIYIVRSALQRQALIRKVEEATQTKLSFFTNVSHSFRTPLTLIADPIRTLLKEGGLNERQQEMLQLMQTHTNELHQLVDKVLGVLQDDLLHDGAHLDAVAEQSVHASQSAAVFRNRQVTVNPEVTTEESRPTILIIDDNADVRRYLTMILSRHQYLVLTAPNGEEGLQVAQQDIPDLIISDVMMPVMDGLECCRLLKAGQATSHIPVLLLTAYGLDDQRIQGYQSGADAYVTKPFNTEVLCARIDSLIQNRRRINPAGDHHQEMDRAEFGDVDRTLVNHFHSFVVEHLSDPDLDIQLLSDEFHMSRVQIYRKCKSLTGQSPVELIRTIRLKAATQLLETSDHTISEIAYECGFSSPSYFSKCYRDQYQVSPTEVQRRHISKK